MGFFDRFHERTRRALFYARREATERKSRAIRSEHLLLGVLREGEDTVMELFRRFGLTPETIGREVEEDEAFGPVSLEWPLLTATRPLANESKRILAHAVEEADAMVHETVGSEHLLLGILRTEGCLAHRALRRLGLSIEGVRRTIGAMREE